MQKEIQIAIALVWRAGRLLVTRRPFDAHLGGLWEFPGGKLEPGETAERCAEREVSEEVAMSVAARRTRTPIRHEYSERTVVLHPVDCEWQHGDPELRGVIEARWVAPRELEALAFPAANAALIRELIQAESAVSFDMP
jgi:mutator protein MutT